jgi:hypothetical protein
LIIESTLSLEYIHGQQLELYQDSSRILLMGIKLITIPLIVGILIIPIINSSGSVKEVTKEDSFVTLTKDDKIFPINHRVAVSESILFVAWADITAPASNNSNYDNSFINIS